MIIYFESYAIHIFVHMHGTYPLTLNPPSLAEILVSILATRENTIPVEMRY